MQAYHMFEIDLDYTYVRPKRHPVAMRKMMSNTANAIRIRAKEFRSWKESSISAFINGIGKFIFINNSTHWEMFSKIEKETFCTSHDLLPSNLLDKQSNSNITFIVTIYCGHLPLLDEIIKYWSHNDNS